MEILTTLAIGAGGGILVLVVEHLFLYVRDKKKERAGHLIRFPNEERIIDENIFVALRHGSSIDLMKSVLGTADKIATHDFPVFAASKFESETDETGDAKQPEGWEDGIGVLTHSYLYKFKNADVKITSKDNHVIDSLTVIAKDSSLAFNNLAFPFENVRDLKKFGEAKVTKQMVKDCRPEFIHTRWDNIFVLSLYLASPTYDFETYFGYVNYKKGIELEKEHPEHFIGGTIYGVCLSQNDTDVFYIYFQELR